MKAHYRWVLWAPLAALALVCYLGGCGVLPSPGFEHSHDHDDDNDHDHEREEAEQQEEEPEPLDPAKMDDAARDIGAEDPSEAIEALEQLSAFLNSDDERLSADAGKVISDTLSDHDNPLIRAAAANALATRADDYAEVLIAATHDEEEVVRETAIGALARSSPGSPGETRLIELSKDPEPAIKAAAVTALTALRQGAGADELVALAAQLGDPDGDASAQAAIALKIKGAQALPVLERVLETADNPRQRHAATMCVALICAGTNPYQEQFAATIKSTHRGEHEVAPADLRGLPILLRAIEDPDPMTREIAAQGLGYLGHARAAQALGKALKDPDTHVRRRAAAALITSPAEPVQRELTDAALRDPDEMVRRFAVEALGWIDDPRVALALIRAAVDPSSEVRRYAAQQLARTDHPAALEALVRLFKDEDEDVRWAAVQAVADKRDRRAAEYLVAALDDPVPQVANAAESGLQKLGIARRRMPGVD